MRKRKLEQDPSLPLKSEAGWLDVENLAEVEVSSELAEHPVEHALLPRHEAGWRAGEPGPQRIRLHFDTPQKISRIYLHFHEPDQQRTQEIVLRWAEGTGEPMQEIVRQQWNFSPQGAPHEIEDFRTQLEGVKLLELEIVPDVSGGSAHAGLMQFFLG